MSPTAAQIVEYFTNVTNENNTIDSVGREHLWGNNFTEPLDAGLSCLAALPAQAKHLVPEPYNLLTINDTVEDIYGHCMDSENNVFDIKLFKERCTKLIEKELDEMNEEHNSTDLMEILKDPDRKESVRRKGNHTKSYRSDQQASKMKRGRKIRTSSRYWTVISHTFKDMEYPFSPPEPFSDRLSYLRSSKQIKVTRLWATSEPKWMTNSKKKKKDQHNEK